MAERNPSILRGKPGESERAPEDSGGVSGEHSDEEPGEESGESPGNPSGDAGEQDALASSRTPASADRESPPASRSGESQRTRGPAGLRAVSLDTEIPHSLSSRSRPASPRGARGQRPVFHVAGFWHRVTAATIDLAVILPVSMIMAWLAGALSGVHLPTSRHHGIDFWLDLLLVGDPALLGITVITLAIATVYILVFQITLAYTPGMRLMRLRIIDQYGDPPTTSRAAVRTSGYLVSMLTLGLGFLWVGFDSEKRGLHDWIAGTHVVKA